MDGFLDTDDGSRSGAIICYLYTSPSTGRSPRRSRPGGGGEDMLEQRAI